MAQAPSPTPSSDVLTVNRAEKFYEQRVDSMYHMMEEQYLTDFVIHVEKDHIHCHRMVLAAASPYFRAMFSHDMREQQQGQVVLENMSSTAVRQVVEYCYTGKLKLAFNDVREYFPVTEHLQLQELHPYFDQFIADNLIAGNCIGYLHFADHYLFNCTKKSAMDVIQSNLTEVAECHEFKELTFHEVIDLLRQAKAVQNSDPPLKAAIAWVTHETDERKKFFPDLLVNIRVEQCSALYLQHVLKEYKDTLVSNPDIHARITQAMMEDERMVVVGGETTGDRLVDKCWDINITTGEYIEFSKKRLKYGSAVCLTPSGILTAGGGTATDTFSATTNCELWEITSNTWKSLPSLKSKVMDAGSACIGDHVYILGGFNNRENTVECLDMGKKVWKSCPKMLQKVRFPIIGVIGEDIYVIFNTTPANRSFCQNSDISLQHYSTTSKVWSLRASLPSSISSTRGASAATVDNLLYVVGGWDRICAQYNPLQNSWSLLQNSIKQHMWGSAVAVRGKLLLCGGSNDGSYTDSVECYSITEAKWSFFPVKLPLPRGYHFCCMFH